MENQKTKITETTGVHIDPSSLTTSAIEGESDHLKELLLSKLEGMAKGIETAHDDMVRFPTEFDKTVGSVKKLLKTKIRYEAKLIKQRIDLEVNHIKELLVVNKEARIEQKGDTQLKIDDALKAQKELGNQQNSNNLISIGKSEDAMIKRMESLDDKITIIRETVQTMQGMVMGTASSKNEKRADNSLIIATIVAVAVIIFGLLNYFKNNS